MTELPHPACPAVVVWWPAGAGIAACTSCWVCTLTLQLVHFGSDHCCPLTCHHRELLATLEDSGAGDGCLWPVVVIDEANMLTRWTDHYPDVLDSFLSNLVELSKQQNRCHVILTTSEYAFQAWLTDSELQALCWGAFRVHVKPAAFRAQDNMSYMP